jgi:ABC-type Zn uptake system ZnuABC Zn-binding protein ZnuA
MPSSSRLPAALQLRPSISRALIVVLAAVLLAGCAAGAGASPRGGTATVQVVATTTVLADLVRQIGGDRVEVQSLVPLGGEAHTFDPKPSDARRIANANLLVMNGLGLDDWLDKLVDDAGALGVPRVVLAKDLPGVRYLEAPAEEPAGTPGAMGGSGSEQPGSSANASAVEPANPHLWMNVAYSRKYVERITQALAGLAPNDVATFRANSAAYDARLVQLDKFVRDSLAALPAENRRVVSEHDAFPYFAAAYGIQIVDVVITVPGQEPSAADVARVIDAIRASHVKAVLSEIQFSAELTRRIASEAGATVVDDLYTDALGAPPVDSYEAMMRWDADRLLKALT